MNRNLRVKELRCIACEIEDCEQLMPTEAHHQNLGGKAGQKRLGDEYTIPLCTWHHRGVAPEGVKPGDATYYMGPSLAHNSKLFRLTYGSDEHLLALTNIKLEQVA
jgi:hypothetical protein